MAGRRFGLELSPDRVEAWARGEGLSVDEPALVARQLSTGKLLGYGLAAKRLGAERPSEIELVSPFGIAELVDREAAAQMLRHLILRIVGRLVFVRHELVLTVPAELSTDGRRSLLEVALSSGARMAHLLDLPLALAFGAGLPVTAWEPSPVLYVLPGSAQSAIVCHHGLLAHRAVELPWAGTPDDGGAEPLVEKVASMLRELLQEAPSPGRAVMRRVGFSLAGRGWDLAWLAAELGRRGGPPIHLVADPEHCVVKGAEVALERIESVGSRTLLYLR